MNYRPALLPKVHSLDLLAAVRGMPCTARIATLAGVPCAPIDTVVPCHAGNLGKGMATKVSDLSVFAGCATCHDIYDRRGAHWKAVHDQHKAAMLERIMLAVFETQAMLFAAGVISVKGAVEPHTPEFREYIDARDGAEK